MKLELKHWAPYLPYGLKFKGHREGYIHQDDEIMHLCVIDCVPDSKWQQIMPILRPLSDLTEQYLLNNGLDYLGRWQIIIGYKQKHFPECIYYNEVQFLLENHFDVFGLIDQGLAIDKNTLND